MEHATEGKCLCPPIHYSDVTKPPNLLSGELCTSPLHSNRLYVYTVCCRRGGQCFSVLRTRHIDVAGDSSGRSYVTEQGHNVPLLRTRGLYIVSSEYSAQGQVLHCKLGNQVRSSAQRQVFRRKLRNRGCSFTRDE